MTTSNINSRLVIDGFEVRLCVWTPSSPTQAFRKDVIEMPGKEFEQERFKGRKLFSFSLAFKAYADDEYQELRQLRNVICPPLSDVGSRVQAPIIHSIEWAPLYDLQVSHFSLDSHSGVVMWNDAGRCYEYSASFKQYSRVMPIVPGLVDADLTVASSFGNNATAVHPATPSSFQPNGINGMVK